MLESPDRMPAAFAAAWAARDATALAALLAEDVDFVNVVGIWWHDRAAIRAAHAYGLSTFFARSRLRFGQVAVRHLGPTVATVHARATLTGQIAPDGTEAGPRRTILLFVMERRAGDWICTAAQNTEIVPGAETHLSDGRTLAPRNYR